MFQPTYGMNDDNKHRNPGSNMTTRRDGVQVYTLMHLPSPKSILVRMAKLLIKLDCLIFLIHGSPVIL
jgi:hypothetical protein